MSAATPSPDGIITEAIMANAIRALAMDAVEAAQSGHPGMPMGMADVATVLVRRFLKFDASDPQWPDRDRFVVSAGHGSMLLYALLHLSGYDGMGMDQIRNFRQLGSRTAGHPEYGHTPGVETTTGPLGQGLANAVGMALAERHLETHFGSDLIDHYTYVIAGDGCLMEGISHEAVSLAGHLGLGRLIVLFDDNGISIDGTTDLTCSDDQLARFAASGWDVQQCDGHDHEAVAAAIAAARAAPAPSLIACRTTIGYGAPNKGGTAATHGAPLGADEIAAARQVLNWPHPPFEIPADIAAAWAEVGRTGASARQDWHSRFESQNADRRREFERRLAGDLPAAWPTAFAALKSRLVAEAPGWATRKASQEVLETVNATLPECIGGSADLTGSNNTRSSDLAAIGPGDFGGRYLFYGVREHAMGAIMNGLALHGGIVPYGGTFMVFSDYMRPAMRMAALMGLRVVYVLSHDSIGLGEDGPTHQPVEHLASLRAIPNLAVFRPADAVETAECWALALERSTGPSALALSRQGLPALRLEDGDENRSAAGAYELCPAENAQVTLLASGSEVSVAYDAREKLAAEGIAARLVSMPCWELFEQQSEAVQSALLGPGTLRLAIEAALPFGWQRWVGDEGIVIGMPGFGASAPAAELFQHFGITADAVVAACKARL
jgi:transketolase